ncbi:M15 family metallopeptidase [Paenibacillus sp. HN-1]|uniref:M15 family metallopeptidase n=1 Tax=Paenibacillus TaxID=44249 RepID=UPI001CA99D33|nr:MULTISPECIES: M15 family metallopeptidase [Paenibacillus]MBY9078319.1 M15 family metallopeptidase [Paenibacillus sp. CGMCC 1.18879]MBY9086022.1 M15 family metallopeptidase [Paenibacillus sinensis]
MLTLEQVKAKSAARLSGLQPVNKDAATALIEFAYAHGVPIVITQGLRTIAEQDALYAQGRTKPGQIVTNAKGGYSYHNFGVAIDFALLLPDGSVSWDTKRDGDGDGVADWSEVVADAKRIGWEWGGDWTSFKDLPHFQMDFGLSTADYRAGKRPTQAQLNAVTEKIAQLEEDEAMTADEKKEFEAAKQLIKAQAGLILDLTNRTTALEARLNIDGKQTYASYYTEAIQAAKAAGAIKTSTDKSKPELNVIQMLYNLGLFNTTSK